MIDSYKFGKMVINDNEYTSDLLLCNSEVKDNWWRKKGHSLCKEDLAWILNHKPDLLIIGTGKRGAMEVPEKLQEELKKLGIEVVVEITDDAVEIFNRRDNVEGKKVAAGFHLTC
ncbi:Mth938-like domain-containing protein [Sporohalobacter salinus]|uniref:Mth938-like domain-containing protein n=1 Tax=Sporohalobacter salinus TaxID=1494606 RepID=UPI001960A872|nr:Mth938-like domain-containing protein [Sporohalobacter salinus]MBM7623566.1 hypothetical protein [Sporohalobacter salinus]